MDEIRHNGSANEMVFVCQSCCSLTLCHFTLSSSSVKLLEQCLLLVMWKSQWYAFPYSGLMPLGRQEPSDSLAAEIITPEIK